MLPPRKWTERWAYEHPAAGIAVLLFGLTMVGMLVWIAVADGCR